MRSIHLYIPWSACTQVLDRITEWMPALDCPRQGTSNSPGLHACRFLQSNAAAKGRATQKMWGQAGRMLARTVLIRCGAGANLVYSAMCRSVLLWRNLLDVLRTGQKGVDPISVEMVLKSQWCGQSYVVNQTTLHQTLLQQRIAEHLVSG